MQYYLSLFKHSKHRNHSVKVGYAFTEMACYSQNLKRYAHSYIRVEDKEHVFCVCCVCMCASAHVSTCIYQPHSRSRLA